MKYDFLGPVIAIFLTLVCWQGAIEEIPEAANIAIFITWLFAASMVFMGIAGDDEILLQKRNPGRAFYVTLGFIQVFILIAGGFWITGFVRFETIFFNYVLREAARARAETPITDE